jgi:predicted metal-dependent enzyme (double-stranded beta helix superfamily)
MTQISRPDRLRAFISRIASLVDETAHDEANDAAHNDAHNDTHNDTHSDARKEAHRLEAGAPALRELIAYDDWLPDAFAQPNPERYQQFLLHVDSR